MYSCWLLHGGFTGHGGHVSNGYSGVLVFALPAHGGVLAWHGGHVADLG